MTSTVDPSGPTAPVMAPAASEPAAALTDAAVRLGGRTIWQQLEIAVAQGEFLAILGPNGAGKSTLLNVLLGFQPLARGEAKVLGQPPGQS